MTSDASVVTKPRRKWGWVFVIAFVLQAGYFFYADMMAEGQRSMACAGAYSNEASDAVKRACDKAYFAKQALPPIFAAISVVCLIGALLGFRRYK